MVSEIVKSFFRPIPGRARACRHRFAWTLFMAAMAAGCLAGGGCARARTESALEVSVLGDSQLALQEYDPLLESQVYDRLSERITLSAAINEVVSFQLVVNGAPAAARSVFVYVEPPRSDQARIGPENIVVYRAIPVRVDRAPGWLLRRWPRPPSLPRYFDALAPVHGAVRLDGAESLPMWVDIRVPYGTEPGIYECHITVTETTGRRTVVPLSLEVWPFALPTESGPVALAPLSARPLVEGRAEETSGRRMIRLSQYDPNRDEGVSLVHDAARLLHDHGLTVYVDDYRPVMKVEPSGRVRVLWEDYDHLVGPLVDGSTYEDRTPAAYWPLPVWPDFPAPKRFGGLDTEVFGRVYRDYVAQCAAHVDKLGGSEARSPARGQAVLIADDSARPTPRAYERFVRLAELARGAAADLRLAAAFCPQDMAGFGWYGFVPMPRPNLVDIWAPAGRYFDPVQARSLAAQGRQMWLRPDEPGYTGSLMVEAPPLDARSLPWQAWQEGAVALWLPPVDRWPPRGQADRLEESPQTHADWLIYPGEMAGAVEPLPSVRLKRLRRGLQDVRYLELLCRHGRPEVARLICDTLFRAGGTDAYGDHFADTRPYGWVEDPAMWALARRLMAEQIMNAMAADASAQDPERAHAIELEWRRLQEGCRKLRLFVEGVELQPSQNRDAPELTVRAHVCLCNETRRSLVGTLRLGEGPSSWARPPELFGRDEESVVSRVETLPPESRLMRRITMSLTNLRATAEGLRVLPLEFDAGEGGRIRADARLAYVVPQELRSPLVLDGDLADWPPGVGHSAGGFRLVGSRPRLPGDRTISDLPTQQTRVYVAADEECLYFGFDCREERMDQLRVGMNNFVDYDGLTPVGEDFVEIVLDPTNARTRSTGDLYHLLVKANGVVLSHRGIACDPPTGPHDLWFSGAEAQVQHHADGWTAEVRLPRRSLPPQAEEWPIWGINFSRFQARLAEYSNWAGAKRHVYSPLSMGNLIWPSQ